jgi:hypothetical protein
VESAAEWTGQIGRWLVRRQVRNRRTLMRTLTSLEAALDSGDPLRRLEAAMGLWEVSCHLPNRADVPVPMLQSVLELLRLDEAAEQRAREEKRAPNRNGGGGSNGCGSVSGNGFSLNRDTAAAAVVSAGGGGLMTVMAAARRASVRQVVRTPEEQAAQERAARDEQRRELELSTKALQRGHAFVIQSLGFIWMMSTGQRAPETAEEEDLLRRCRRRLTGVGVEEVLLNVFARYGAKLHFANHWDQMSVAQRRNSQSSLVIPEGMPVEKSDSREHTPVQQWRLRLHSISASDLMHTSTGSADGKKPARASALVDPYFRVYLNGETVGASPMLLNTCNPIWDESFEFTLTGDPSQVILYQTL